MRFRRFAQSRLLVRNGIGQVSYRGTIRRSREDCELIVISCIHPCGKWHRSGHDGKVTSGSSFQFQVAKCSTERNNPFLAKRDLPCSPVGGLPARYPRYHTIESQSVIRTDDGTVAGPLLINFKSQPSLWLDC